MLQQALAKLEGERQMVASIADRSYEAPWVDATLARLQCYVEE